MIEQTTLTKDIEKKINLILIFPNKEYTFQPRVKLIQLKKWNEPK